MTIHFRIKGAISGANTDSIGFEPPEGRSAVSGFEAQHPYLVQDNGSFNPGRLFINSSPVAAADEVAIWSENQFSTAQASVDLIGQIIIDLA